MPSRAPLIRLLAAAVVAGGVATPGAAQGVARSPFMPTAAVAAAATTPGATLEFRGRMDLGDGLQFRLYDPAKKAGVWVRLNERSAEFEVVVKQHDEEQKTLTIEHQGRTLTLAERVSKVVSAGTAAQMMPPPAVAPAPPSNVAPAVTQSVVLNPTPADEARRLEAVASEVARRRAMREQASQQVNQGMPPPPPPAAGQPAGTAVRPQAR
jgi:hypothetical protein